MTFRLRRTYRQTGAFTLPEALVGGAIFLITISALLFALSGSRKEEELSSLYLSVMESAAVATHQLHLDLRQTVVLSHKPLEPYSVRISEDYQALRLRHATILTSTAATSNETGALPFVYVEYRLTSADRHPGRYHLVRTEQTTDGSPLPGKNVSYIEKVFRSCLLKRASFLTKGDDETRTQVLHVGLTLISDSGTPAARRRKDRRPFDEKILHFTSVLQIQQPEAPYADPTFFAEEIDVPDAEVPPSDIVSTVLASTQEIPPFPEDGPPRPTVPLAAAGNPPQALATRSPEPVEDGGESASDGETRRR